MITKEYLVLMEKAQGLVRNPRKDTTSFSGGKSPQGLHWSLSKSELKDKMKN